MLEGKEQNQEESERVGVFQTASTGTDGCSSGVLSLVVMTEMMRDYPLSLTKFVRTVFRGVVACTLVSLQWLDPKATNQDLRKIPGVP